MKRKWAWLALPMLLAALMLGVKWRAEHPTPTKADLEWRAILSQAHSIDFHHSGLLGEGEFDGFYREMTQAEAKPLIECLHLLPMTKRDRDNSLSDGIKGKVLLIWKFSEKRADNVGEVWMSFRVAEKEGWCVLLNSHHHQTYRLHPATIKRWMELLLANPRIGQRLRARLK